MTLAKAEPKSQFIMRTEDYVNLLVRIAAQLKEKLATELTKKNARLILCCAAELMSYFKHWNEWKRLHYKEAWFYRPLRKIREDLFGPYSLHVVSKAIGLLAELGFLSIDKNNLELNNRNGQNKTHRYLLHCDRVNAALAKFKPKSSSQSKQAKKPENLATSPLINVETPLINIETSSLNVETHIKILSTDPSTNPSSLLEEREEVDFVQ